MLLVLVTAILMLLLPMGTGTAGADSGTGDTLPLAAGMCINKAEALIRNEKLQEAITVLETFKAKQKEVDDVTATRTGYSHYYIDFLLGNTCLMRSEVDAAGRTNWLKKAARAYEQAVGKKKDLSPAWLNLAKCRYDLGEMEKAAMAFVTGYDSSREKTASHLYYAAICYFQSNDHPKALMVFNRLIKAHPDQFSLEWRETFVSILSAMDKFKTTLPHVEVLAREFTGTKKKKWQEILLYQYLNLGMDKKALEYGQLLTHTDPTEPTWWKAVAHLYLNRNDLKNGLSHLLIYSYLVPPSREEKSLMADLYLSVGIPSQALALYEKVLGEKEDSEKINRIIHACTAAHEPEKALAWIDRGLALKPTVELLTRKAGLLYEMQDYDKAATLYEQLIQKAPKPGEYFLLLGYCAWNLDQLDRARNAFEKACTFEKQKKAALQAIDQLNQRLSG